MLGQVDVMNIATQHARNKNEYKQKYIRKQKHKLCRGDYRQSTDREMQRV